MLFSHFILQTGGVIVLVMAVFLYYHTFTRDDD